jgi:hypothetical protein
MLPFAALSRTKHGSQILLSSRTSPVIIWATSNKLPPVNAMNKKTLVCGSLFLNFFSGLVAGAAASPAQIPMTGQILSYDADAPQKDDGATRAGVKWPDPRFKDNGDQTVTDNLTGLMWTKDANAPGAGTCGSETTMNWQTALDYVACLNANNYLGHNDWSLPNINELESLVNAGQSNTATWLNGQGFSNVQSNYYWSSTSAALRTSNAWFVNMEDGSVEDPDVDFKLARNYVWPVRQPGSLGPSAVWRSGQMTCYDTDGNMIPCAGTGQDGDRQQGVAWPSRRFTDNGDQTVTDNLTNLIWTRNADAPGPSACGSGASMDWQRALDYVACLNANNFLGHSDWRLPNRKELHSLTDFSEGLPALPSGNPFANVQSDGYYWSSTSKAAVPDAAWFVHISGGYMSAYNKSSLGQYVWPVRGGQLDNSVNLTNSLAITSSGPSFGFHARQFGFSLTGQSGCTGYRV